VKKTRVLVANRLRVMREAVAALLAGKPDIEIVGEIPEEFQNEPGILQAIEAAKPDFLIVTLEKPAEPLAICRAVLSQYPKLKILAVAAGVSDSTCYWAMPEIHSRRIKTTEEAFLGTLRGAANDCGKEIL